jgi:predicted DNA-binding transcriptional regulator YafY
MITVTGPDDARLHKFLEWAIKREKPVTITYYKQAKRDGKLLWGTDDKGARVALLEPTVRTIEPWALEDDSNGQPFVRGMDRKTGDPRSWRLDRIQKITYHKRGRDIVPAYVTTEGKPVTQRVSVVKKA